MTELEKILAKGITESQKFHDDAIEALIKQYLKTYPDLSIKDLVLCYRGDYPTTRYWIETKNEFDKRIVQVAVPDKEREKKAFLTGCEWGEHLAPDLAWEIYDKQEGERK